MYILETERKGYILFFFPIDSLSIGSHSFTYTKQMFYKEDIYPMYRTIPFIYEGP